MFATQPDQVLRQIFAGPPTCRPFEQSIAYRSADTETKVGCPRIGTSFAPRGESRVPEQTVVKLAEVEAQEFADPLIDVREKLLGRMMRHFGFFLCFETSSDEREEFAQQA